MKKSLITLFALCLGWGLSASAQEAAPAQAGPPSPAQQPQSAPPPTEGQEDVQALMAELQQLSQRIEAAQQQARESSEVQEALVDYARSLEEEMLQIEPEREEDIKRKGALMVEIIQLEDPVKLSSEEQQEVEEKVQEHQALNTELAAVQEQAMQAERVQEKEANARQIQIAKMQEHEPRLMEIVRQRGELVQRIQTIHGQRSQQPTGSGS